MLRRAVPLLVMALMVTSCNADDDDETVAVEETTSSTTTTMAPTPSPDGTVFTWTTTMDLDGYGFTLTVDGSVADDHARYTMQVEPFSGSNGGDNADYNASIAGAAVNGLRDPGAGTTIDTVDPDGATEVVVIGEDRWYRLPWLIDEADFAMQGAEWVRVSGPGPFVADIASFVLDERYDDALRSVLETVAAGERVQAPRPPPDQTEFDDLLSPWIGLAGPGRNGGSPAVITGDETDGTVEWDEELTYEPDGSDGHVGAEVTWRAGEAPRPEPPDPADVIDIDVLAERLSQAG